MRNAFVLNVLAAIGFFVGASLRVQNLYAQPGPPGDKNLQVLKGLPEGHREKIMDYFAASLGVKCGHCHVIDSTGWHMDLDDKQAKKTARVMMQMVMDINTKNFGGRNEVTCFTCHRGSTEPASTIALPLPPSPPPGPEGEAAIPALPSVDEVLTKAEKALGSPDAMKKISSRVSKGTLLTGDGREMPLEMTWQAPDKFISTTTMKDGAQSTRAFDGKKGWMSSPRGTREMSPQQSEEMRNSGSISPLPHLKTIAKTMRVTGKTIVNGTSAYILEAPAGDHVVERYCFDAESGVLLRKVVLTETMIADIPEQTDYADYRAADGIKVPFEVRVSSADARNSFTRKLNSVVQNVPIDTKKFEMPPVKK